MTSNMFFRSRLGAPGDSCQSDEHLETDDNGEAHCVPDNHLPFNGDCPSGYHPGPFYGPGGAQTVCYKSAPELICPDGYTLNEDGWCYLNGPTALPTNHCGAGRIPGPGGEECMPAAPCPAGQVLGYYGQGEGWECVLEGPETGQGGQHGYVKAPPAPDDDWWVFWDADGKPRDKLPAREVQLRCPPNSVWSGEMCIPNGVVVVDKTPEETSSSSIPTIGVAIGGAAIGALAGRALGKGSPSITVAGAALGGLVGALAGAWLKP